MPQTLEPVSFYSVKASPVYRAICRNGRMRQFYDLTAACEWLDEQEPQHIGAFHNVLWVTAIMFGAMRNIHHVTHKLQGE